MRGKPRSPRLSAEVHGRDYRAGAPADGPPIKEPLTVSHRSLAPVRRMADDVDQGGQARVDARLADNGFAIIVSNADAWLRSSRNIATFSLAMDGRFNVAPCAHV
jgi:hypothetical protein